jgi:hypothetical protein
LSKESRSISSAFHDAETAIYRWETAIESLREGDPPQRVKPGDLNLAGILISIDDDVG